MKVQGIVESVQYANEQVHINYNLRIDGTELGQRNTSGPEKEVHAENSRALADVQRFVKAALVAQFPNATGVEIARRKAASPLVRPVDQIEVIEV